jgi:hypothetical protein
MLPYFAILFGASEGCQTILVIKRESFIETNLQYIMQQAISCYQSMNTKQYSEKVSYCSAYHLKMLQSTRQGMGNGEPKRETYMIFTESFMFYL